MGINSQNFRRRRIKSNDFSFEIEGNNTIIHTVKSIFIQHDRVFEKGSLLRGFRMFHVVKQGILRPEKFSKTFQVSGKLKRIKSSFNIAHNIKDFCETRKFKNFFNIFFQSDKFQVTIIRTCPFQRGQKNP